jgi:hypothetical protein
VRETERPTSEPLHEDDGVVAPQRDCMVVAALLQQQ